MCSPRASIGERFLGKSRLERKRSKTESDHGRQREAVGFPVRVGHGVLRASGVDKRERERIGRASLDLHHGLVELSCGGGFASRSDESFVPLVATVLPGLFVLGLFTVIRLVDLNGHYLQHLAGMARIRAYYRELTPEAADYFSPEETRLPRDVIPSLQLGMSIAFLTTSSTMLASINNIVAGAGIALLARRLLGPDRTLLAVLVGVTGAGALTAAFLTFQKWRFSMFQPPPGSATRIDRPRK